MSKPTIPSFFFPTTVLMVDDNVEFLKSIAMCLSTESATYNFYSDPRLALKLINDKHHCDQVAGGLINLVDEEEIEHKTLDINVRDIHRIMYNKSRFQQISTVVVDYHMAGMDGIQFCKSIKNPNIQKILLTSIVDENKAIEVLNEGLIHTFIRKQSPNVMQLLAQAINTAQNRYFLNASRIFQQIVTSSPDESALSRPAFVELFQKIRKDFGAVEYYLAEFLGSFVFLDADGKHYGLFTKISDQIDFYCDSKEAESAPAHVIETLKSKKQILCYHNESSLSLPHGQVWEQYMLDATKIPGPNPYYCAYGPELFDIRIENLLSFNDYSSPMGLSINS